MHDALITFELVLFFPLCSSPLVGFDDIGFTFR